MTRKIDVSGFFRNRLFFVSPLPAFVIIFKNKTTAFRRSSPLINLRKDNTFLIEERLTFFNQVNFKFLTISHLYFGKSSFFNFEYYIENNLFEEDNHYIYFSNTNTNNAEQFFVWLLNHLLERRIAKLWGIGDNKQWIELQLKRAEKYGEPNDQ